MLKQEFVNKPENWIYSSAIDYYYGKGLLEIKFGFISCEKYYLEQVRYAELKASYLCQGRGRLEEKKENGRWQRKSIS